MVYSNKSTITYIENNKIDEQDINQEVDIYETELMGVNILISLGKQNKTYQFTKNIVYFPIYLIDINNKKQEKIGIYEIDPKEYINYLDNSGEIDIDKLDNPLLFQFVNFDFLKKYEYKIFNDENGENSENNFVNNNNNKNSLSDVLTPIKGLILAPLQPETELSSNEIKKNYINNDNNSWISKFMKNNHYEIYDQGENSDCFFSSLRDAYATIGFNTTIPKIRIKLANYVTSDMFEDFYENYVSLTKKIKDCTEQINLFKHEYSLLRKSLTSSFDKANQITILTKAKEVKTVHDQYVKDKKIYNSLLNDFSFMKGITTHEYLVKHIKSNKFHITNWAIELIEKIFNIKFIVLSKNKYNQNDVCQLLDCSIDSNLSDDFIFNPSHYVILEKNKNMYNLVSYKNKCMLTLLEIPYDIKNFIKDKCIEENGGLFMCIPEFYSNVETNYSNIYKNNHNPIFMLNDFSTENNIPGKGFGEKISDDDAINFAELNSFENWRNKLSPMWIQSKPFLLENKEWCSVENFFQASKFKNKNPTFYKSFSLTENTPISKNPAMAKCAGTSGKFNEILIRPKNIVPDSDFNKRKHHDMFNAWHALASQNEEFKNILINTKNATLIRFVKGKPPIVCNELMKVREKL